MEQMPDYAANNNSNSREMPHDLLAEKSFIGSLIIDNQAFDEISDLSIQAEDFYHPQYGVIYQGIFELAGDSEPFDVVSICAKLNDMGKLEKVGGQAAVLDIIEDQVSSANIAHYGKIIRDKSTLRAVVRNSMRVTEAGMNFVGNMGEFLNEVEAKFFNLTSKGKKSAIVSLKDSLRENLKELERGQKDAGEISGLTTGFPSVDKKLLGMQAGQLIVVAARPAMGKTSLALNIALNACKASNLPVAIFSYEMISKELSGRILSSEANVDSVKIRTRDYTDMDLRNMAHAVQKLSNLPIYINDSGATTLLDIRSQCRKIKANDNLGLIVIDYLQLMNPHVRKQSREQEISEISRGLKELAKELEVPIMALSQLNRSAASRTDRRPALQDLRESGAIEQDADIVCLIHREEAYDPNTPEKGIAEVIVAKNRGGEPGTVRMAWIGAQTKFAELQNQPSQNE